MEHRAAEEEAARLRREHPDRLTHTWMARGLPDGEWEVVKARIPGRRLDSPRGAADEPTPPRPGGPPPDPSRDVPPFGAA